MDDYIESIQLKPAGWRSDVPFRWSMELILKDPTGQQWAEVRLNDPPYLQADHYDSSYKAWRPAVFLWRPYTEDMNFFWFMHRDYPLDEYTMGAYGGEYKLIDGRTVKWAGGWSSNEDHFRDVTGLDLMSTIVRGGQYTSHWLYVRREVVDLFIAKNQLPMKFIVDPSGGYMLVPDWFIPNNDDY